jgi:glycosyltransferase involved in cell wall biosynthesis
MNILFVHLLNNYTGSPQVLATILKKLSLKKEWHISLLTSGQDGCLSGIANVIYHNNHYKMSNNKVILLMYFLISQFYIFFFILSNAKRIDVIYINTILPFSAAFAGTLIHKKIIYHIHEVYIHPNIVQKVMRFTAERYADKIFTVSHYVSANIKRASTVLYNALSEEFKRDAQKSLEDKSIAKYKFIKKNILMVSSLKKYKGVDVFVSLARKCPQYSFSLVVSSPEDDIRNYFSCTPLSNNLIIIPQKKNLLSYYLDTSIVLNLSIPDLCIETFGMTLLEGMQFGTPCIAPDFGGPKEIILNGKNGFLVDPYDEDAIITAMNTILASEAQYITFFKNALDSGKRFSIDRSMIMLIDNVNAVIYEQRK